MKVYKFKSLTNFDHVADIFFERRFHTAHFSELNDPMEGRLYYCEKETKREYLDKLRKGLDKTRICAFSKTYANILLWAHYADGFKGICIEVMLEEWPNYEIVPVQYHPPGTWLNLSNTQADYVESWAREVLRGKYDAWQYEKEIRVLTDEEYINRHMCKIESVLLGTRISDPMKNAVIKLVPKGVKIYTTHISGVTNRVIRRKLPNRQEKE